MVQVPYVFIGDDFTGASDTLATLADRNWRTRLFLTEPEPEHIGADSLDAIGIATDFRALPPVDIVEHLERWMPAVTALHSSIVHYKICSTFDSAPHTGNIAAAVDTLERWLRPELTLIIGGQPSLGRFCAYGNLFARASDGQVYRIDRHPIMKCHPITPMHEADLRDHLEHQGLSGLGHVTLDDVTEGARRVSTAIAALVASGTRRILCDAVEDQHLQDLGEGASRLRSADRPFLVVGASSVAEAFAPARPRPVGQSEDIADSGTARMPSGPTLVIAGSRSSVTAAQVRAASQFQKRSLAVEDLCSEVAVGRVLDECGTRLSGGNNLLLHLRPEIDYGRTGTDLSIVLAKLATSLLERFPLGQLGIAGGDTSSILARGLGLESLSFECRLGPGTAVCRAGSGDGAHDGLRILFKGGQVGPVDIFDMFARGLSRKT